MLTRFSVRGEVHRGLCRRVAAADDEHVLAFDERRFAGTGTVIETRAEKSRAGSEDLGAGT